MKIAFLDRDGVINVNTGYLYRVEDFQFTPGCLEALKDLKKLGYHIAIITNQSGIARGYYTEDDYHRLNSWMLEQFNQQGIDVLQVTYCPHLPNGSVPEYTGDCDCRKPKPGMINDIIANQVESVDLASCILVGDNVSDIEAGKAAGLGHLYLIGEGHSTELESHFGCSLFPSLCAVTQFLTNSIPQ